MNYNWLVFANKSKCNHAKALQELGYISWRQDRVRFAIGDIVYLFMSNERCVRFKTIVTAANQERGDSAYWNGVAPKDKTFKLELLEEYTGDALSETKLFEVFLRGQYRDVILPMVVLRRLDALLEPTKVAVEQEYKSQIEAGLADNLDEEALKDESGQTYYNLSKWTLNRLKNQSSDNNDINYTNFIEYLNGYSENVKDVLKNFEFYAKVKKLADNDRLISIIERITDPRLNLTDRPATDPDGLPLPAVSNLQMGTLFEELLRRFNEENNEEAGEHFTPRDVIELLANSMILLVVRAVCLQKAVTTYSTWA